jgi:predicted metal-dependent phosphoesterase TrpH
MIGRDPLAERCFADLHCHTNRSFDSLSDPRAAMHRARARGLTHLAITDHERIDGALWARDQAPEGLTLIVGEEMRSQEGDILGLFLEEAIPGGLPAEETIARIHAQGGVAGIPHPFDRFRGSAAKDGDERLERLAPLVDYIETYNARVAFGDANDRAARFARAHGLPGLASSDAHTLLEVGIAYTVLPGPIASAADLRRALATLQPSALMPGHASVLVRGFMPVAKAIQRLRGNRRRIVRT